MSKSKPKPPSPAKPAPGAKKPAWIKPRRTSSPIRRRARMFAAEMPEHLAEAAGYSDAALKSRIEPILHALSKLRELRF